MKTKKRLVLKPFVVPTLYTIFAVAILVSLFYSIDITPDENIMTYVSSTILDEYVPVINVEEKIVRPYTSDKVTVLNDYYDYKGTDESQQTSILLHDNTYIQNTGINYTSDEQFDIVSILNGEVVDVKDNELLGKTVTIRHEKELISVYQSLGEVSVKKGDKVTTGQVIGKSGSCDLIVSKENNLHFEVYLNGEVENPNTLFDKKLGEI